MNEAASPSSPTPNRDAIIANRNPFFNLTAASLTRKLLERAGNVEKTVVEDANVSFNDREDKEIFLQALLYNVASTATGIMEQESRLRGELQARQLSQANSLLKVGPYETLLYDVIGKGDVDAVTSIVQPQKITFTSHPNFSRSRKLVALSRELASELGALSKEEQDALAKKDANLPDNANIGNLLAQIKSEIKPRNKRTRKEELDETTIDMIPTIIGAAEDQMRIFKSRWKRFHLPDLKNEKDVTPAIVYEGDEKQPWLDENDARLWRNADQYNQPVPVFKNLKQIEAFAAMLPEFNTWFMDGDGKRTVHSWDTEVAVPAIKRATYEMYDKLLERMGDVEGIKEMKTRLGETIEVLKRVEELAAARMDTLNNLHRLHKLYQEDADDLDISAEYHESVEAAKQASEEYSTYMKSQPEGLSTKVLDLLKRDDALTIKNTIGSLLTKEYDNATLSDLQRNAAETLYASLSRYGNYAVHIQRRENARQYKEVFEYLLQNDEDIRFAVVQYLNDHGNPSVSMPNLMKKIRKPEIYDQAVAAFSEVIQSAELRLNFMDSQRNMLKHYNDLKNKLGGTDDDTQERVMDPLEYRESLALDALGVFRMAALYPEAFKGGTIVAEFAQPEIGTLRDGEPQEIAAEVTRIAKNDLTLQMAFCRAMGVPDLEIIPLYEDPSSMMYAAAAVKDLHEKSFMDHLKSWIGITGEADFVRTRAEKKALKHIDDTGAVVKLTAYDFLQQYGVTNAELETLGLNVEQLRNTFVLEGPHDMEACSDNNKRAGVMGSILAERSVRNKVLAAAALPQNIEGVNYIIVKPKYLGQGGSMARAVKSPIDTVQATWQGEHANNLTHASLAHMSYNSMLSRLYLREEAARAEERRKDKGPSDKGVVRAVIDAAGEFLGLDFGQIQSPAELLRKFANVGNVQGLPAGMLLDDQYGKLLESVNARLQSTRDDPRYNDFLKKYGEPVSNYSARPDAKSGGSSDGPKFNSGRAIGIAGLESGVFSNIIAFADVFSPGEPNGGVERIKKWRDQDPMMQQLITAASITANMVDLKEKWKRGGIDYQEKDGEVLLVKKKTKGKNPGTAKVKLSELKAAYDDGADKYVSKESSEGDKGIVFDAGDLVMAHLTDQYHRLLKGLGKVHGTTKKIEFLPEQYREDVQFLSDLNSHAMQRWLETKPERKIGADPEEESPELKNMGKLALDSYYLMHESGVSYPMPGLLEEKLFPRTDNAPLKSMAAI